MTPRRVAIALIGAEIGLAALFGVTGAMGGIHGVAYASGPQEDEPGWSCVDDGNRICGPGNTNGAPAGCYDDGGVLVAVWPCHVIVNSADVYTGPPMA